MDRREGHSKLTADNLDKAIAGESIAVTPSEAIYGFAAFLSQLNGTFKIGRTHNAAVLADLVDQYCKKQKYEPPRDSKFPNNLREHG